MSTVVAGVDFGTLSVRVSLFDRERSRLDLGIAEYPLHRKRDAPQGLQDHTAALVQAMGKALQSAGIGGKQQAGCESPCLGTTHADYFRGPVPVTDVRIEREIESGCHQSGRAGALRGCP
ncbi:MAG TPA: hypothetical protein VJN89_04375 [Candidatus Acidoferrum sp.]|nr:hypothetical protein [Candidatus Acidoferrum sp.]